MYSTVAFLLGNYYSTTWNHLLIFTEEQFIVQNCKDISN